MKEKNGSIFLKGRAFYITMSLATMKKLLSHGETDSLSTEKIDGEPFKVPEMTRCDLMG